MGAAEVAGDLQGNGVTADVAAVVGEDGGFGGAYDLDGDSDLAAVGDEGAVDGQIGDSGGDAAGGVSEVAIQELTAFEGCGLRDAVDGGQDGVNLQLISGDLAGTESAGVGSLSDEALELSQKGADFVEAAFGSSDNIASEAGVVDGGLNSGLFLLQTEAGDQTGRVVGAGVDLQAGAEALQAFVEIGVVLQQRILCNKRTDVRVNYATHVCLSVTL